MDKISEPDNTICKSHVFKDTHKVNSRSVFMTVGPSTAGKTTFCLNFLKENLPGIVKYISSDDIRTELLNNYETDKYSREMMAISELAFDQLFSRVKTYMTWPCSVDFIIIDTTGLCQFFSNKLLKLCEEKNYNLVPIVFDYKTYDEYHKYSMDKPMVTSQVDNLRKKIIPKLTSDFSRIIRIRNRNFSQCQIRVTDWNKYQSCFLNKDVSVVIIGNVNGCYEELILLLKQFRINLNEDGILETTSKIVLLGNPYSDNDHSDRLRLLIEKNKIICVYEDGLPFVSVRYKWIATASYQTKNYLGSRNESNCTDISDKVFNEPYRIFGSYPSLKFEHKDNLYLIDGGCVHGGELIGLSFDKKGNPFIKKQLALLTYIPGERKLFFPEEIKIITPDTLSQYLKYRYNKIITSGAPFLSGTMSPAASKKSEICNSDSFESLSEGLFYYKRLGVRKVCLQPKYMGSRCTIVLNNNGPCYAISRNGFIIRIAEISNILLDLKNKFLHGDISIMIIDGELLPWSAMGKSLIDDTYRSVEVGLTKDLELLKKYNFEKQLEVLKEARSNISLPLQKSNINKIGQGLYHTMVSYDSFISNWTSIDSLENGLYTYSEQLNLFTDNSPLEFKPFALLKTIDKNGKEEIYNEEASVNYRRVSTDHHLVVSTDDLSAAMGFYDFITKDKKMEGIVIKPEIPINNSIVPYLKVRNTNYLTMVYGPTYQHPKRLNSLIKRKSVVDKQKLSSLQYRISREILNIPFKSLGPNNEYYCNLVATFLQSNEDESKLDPRL